MKPLRFAPLLAALCLTLPAAAQDRGATLTPFRSETDLTAYLRRMQIVADSASKARAAAHAAWLAAQPPAPPPVPCGETRQVGRGTVAAPNGLAVITGSVRDQSGNAVAGARVTVPARLWGATTGTDGEFRLQVPDTALGGGRLALRAAAIGHSVTTTLLEMNAGDSARVSFSVCEQGLALESVVVTGAVAGAAKEEGITNTQHAGVDEGGIVKVHGNHLVVLRRGRLFTLAIGGDSLRPVDAVDAYRPGGGDGWYDEMLISGDQIVVIGYTDEGTELGVFRIGADGRIRHRDTYSLRSGDYYSSENYASRLIGTRLVVYSPVYVNAGEPLGDWMPAMRRWHADVTDDEYRRTLSATRIYRAPRVPDDGAMLHTVTTCELGVQPVECRSTAVLGSAGRVFYVSPTAVYVWAGGSHSWGPVAESALYRLPLDGSAPRALAVRGSPLDQFSFLEQDGMLNVVVSSDGSGDGMWRSQRGASALRLLRVPVSSFGTGARQVAASRYRPLPPVEDNGPLQNRFVGSHLLYGTGGGWGAAGSAAGSVQVVRIADGQSTRLTLPHAIGRIEVMGRDAVIAGASEEDLYLTGIRLGIRPSVVQRFVRRNASEGETRSHGFFYRADGDDSGMLGLPFRGEGESGYSQLTEGSAGVLFLRNADRQFRALGELVADQKSAVDDGCVASCVDWYGNARPIFLRGRVFALMGYEIVEGALDDGRLRERRRVSFAPPRRATAASN
ncbi:beta-propeller domain-containing protein [Longimicrobium terrae]|uniref:Carboxypeptidase regulatory-like domain-containing protein n=1 Tax=Longimicrobium terrae TaxID=1639882 RepID=A0A841H584_9BACT|nr:beta-propeller domain-containing protein [Longimicrobium terrae]MBB4638998.1 hypothetical protein [Longimicrobium terrae]MBB6073237.1 hypothetical protein [Longimicrobium terrae]NNC32312.1 hypothetical protein [Longimicrobium terrae]